MPEVGGVRWDDENVSETEAREMADPLVGDGSPERARSVDVPGYALSWIPTRKWLAAAAVAHLGIVAHAIASGGWDTTEWGELVAVWSGLIPAYLIGNDPTPGGVPFR